MNMNAYRMRASLINSKLKENTNAPASCADHPTPHVGTRHKRKAAAPSGGAQGAKHGLAALADMASKFTAGQKLSVPLSLTFHPGTVRHCTVPASLCVYVIV